MLGLNLHDLFGSIIAILLFPIVSIVPGYCIGWVFNIFDFKNRLRLTRYIIGIVLSNAAFPIVFYLVYRYESIYVLSAALFILTCLFIIIDIVPLFRGNILKRLGAEILGLDKLKKFALVSAGLWIVFSLLLLVDLNIGNKLYFATTSYDYTTRIAVINAITRTGVPPVNPTYYPGHPELLNYLYYYWYISPSIIDWIAGNFVNSRQAMIASVGWCGLCLMATLALYLRLRKNHTNSKSWIAPLIGIQLFLISGVDVIPVLMIAISARLAIGQMIFNGRIEGWNTPIMSWLNAVTWVPNHISATLQCITALLVVLVSLRGTTRQKLSAVVIAGLAFASALGSSVWVTLTFAVAWIVWALILLLSNEDRKNFWVLTASGLLGAGLSIPYIASLISSGGNSSGALLPIAFYVRPFILGVVLFPEKLQSLANFFLLPLNYLMELGFFFAISLHWFQYQKEQEAKNNPFVTAEIILLTTVVIILSFVYSTVIAINDLGIRAWLLGQFVLLVWAVDVIQNWLGSDPPFPKMVYKVIRQQPKIGRALQILLILGFLTTGLETFSTRMWPLLVDWNIAGFPNAAEVTNLAFGGSDHETLYVTAQGEGVQRGVFKLKLSVPGMPY